MINIILDTNILNMSYSRNAGYDTFFFNKKFDEIVGTLGKNSLKDQVKLLIPQLVIEELFMHKLDAYEKELTILKQIKENMSSLAEIQYQYDSREEYEKFLSEKLDNFLRETKSFEIMPNCGQHFFEQIIEKAVKKEAPFEGREKASDKGFKDVVIYFSIVDYAMKNKGTFYYITKDEKFHGNDGKLLSGQFKQWSGCDFLAYREFQEILSEIIVPDDVTCALNYLEYEIVEERHYFGKEIGEVKTILTYQKPQFCAENHVLKRIKYDIDRIYKDDLVSWKSQSLTAYDGEIGMEYCGSIDVDVKYNVDGICSMVFTHFSYLGGIHGGSWYTCRIYDLKTGDPLSLRELINRPEEDILQMVYEKCEEDKRNRAKENLYFDNFEARYHTLDEVKFYLDIMGLHIYFDEYEAGCYASGIIDFVLLPIDKIDYLK